MPLDCVDQAVPFHFKMVPPPPTAQTLAALVPHTPESALEVPLDCGDQAVPFHFKIVPAWPTAQTLAASVPPTPLR